MTPWAEGRGYIEFTTDEGTWVSLDISPDGKTVLFGLLGDLYLMDKWGRPDLKQIGQAKIAGHLVPPYASDLLMHRNLPGTRLRWPTIVILLVGVLAMGVNSRLGLAADLSR